MFRNVHVHSTTKCIGLQNISTRLKILWLGLMGQEFHPRACQNSNSLRSYSIAT